MAETEFHIFSTAGNTTLFVEQPGAARAAIAALPCEQAACADLRVGEAVMAGGEFCVNACLAFAALQSLKKAALSSMLMAGHRIGIAASGSAPVWQTSAILPFGRAPLAEKSGYLIARLPCICHVLLETDVFPEEAEARLAGARLAASAGLAHEPAAGIIWWRRADDAYAIMPLVMVPGAGTCNVERACGSGSLALALCLGKGDYRINQPSGEALGVRHMGEELEITAQSRLVAHGEMWLP